MTILGSGIGVPFKGPIISGLYTSQYEEVLKNNVVEPTDQEKEYYNLFVKRLVDASLWNKHDRLHLMCSHASGIDSLLDWIHPGDSGKRWSLVNLVAADWTKYVGYLGDGSTKYGNSNFAPASDGVNYTQNSVGIYAHTITTGINAAQTLFGYGPASSDQSTILPRFLGNARTQIHDNVAVVDAVADSDGMTQGGRKDANTVELSKNGSLLNTNSTSPSVVQTNPAHIFYLAQAANGDVPQAFFNGNIGIAGIASYLTPAEFLIISNAFNELKTNLLSI